MRNILLLITLAGLTSLAANAQSVPTTKPPPDRSSAAVALGSSRLDDERVTVREEATGELAKIGKPALAALRDALLGRPNPELRMRAQYILDRCAGGEAIAGLKIALSADKQQLAPGGKLTLRVTLTNQTRKTITLYVGYGQEGANFTSGAALRLLVADPKKEGRVKVVLPRWRSAALIAATERPVLVTLRAGGTKKFRLPVTLVPAKDKPGEARWLLGERALMSLDAPHSDVVRLKIAHTVTAQMNRAALGPRGKKESGLSLWSGAMHSNEVKIKVVAAK